nr:hypothetical protein [Clostridium argentinense]
MKKPSIVAKVPNTKEAIAIYGNCSMISVLVSLFLDKISCIEVKAIDSTINTPPIILAGVARVFIIFST